MKRQKPFALIAFDKMIMPIGNGRGNFVHQGALLGSAFVVPLPGKTPALRPLAMLRKANESPSHLGAPVLLNMLTMRRYRSHQCGCEPRDRAR
jgi:hypothetical protein